MKVMESNILSCGDQIPLITHQKWSSRIRYENIHFNQTSKDQTMSKNDQGAFIQFEDLQISVKI